MNKINIMIIFGGISKEYEVSIMSAINIINGLDKNKYNIYPVIISKFGEWGYLGIYDMEKYLDYEFITRLYDGRMKLYEVYIKLGKKKDRIFIINDKEIKIDVVFPVLHGKNGEDGIIQGFLEVLNIPYIGSGVLSSAIAMDKSVIKILFKAYNLPQADFYSIKHKEYLNNSIRLIKDIESEIKYPMFVKPSNMGSSIGIRKVKDRYELIEGIKNAFKYDKKVIVEEFISGKEVESSVLGNDNISISIPAEIVFSNEFYDYEDKYFSKASRLTIPADVNNHIFREIRRLSHEIYNIIDCSGLARIDFFVEHRTNKVLINEVNTIPGFTNTSAYLKMWEASGVPFEKLLDKLIYLAIEKSKEKNDD